MRATARFLAIPVLAILAMALSAGCGGGGGNDDTLPDVTDAEVATDPGTETVEDARPDIPPDLPDSPDVCVPDCTGKVCGPDGCGSTCGTCPAACGGPTLAECQEGVCAVPCCPNCTGRVCGSDGCGGTCAPGCTGADVCNPADGTCVTGCEWTTDKPTTWGPTGVISSLQTPADVAVVQATCFDYTADGKGDNGLKGLAGQVNGPLADAVSGGSIAILFELLGVTDFTTTASFQLNGLLGVSTVEPPATTGDFFVQESAYIQETCLPMIYFKDAKITAGVLEAGPSMFQLSIPIQEGLVIDATLIQAKLKGTIKNGDAATGFELEGGVLSGVLTKEQLKAAIDKLQATCDAAPAAEKPDYCSYLTVATSAMALLFDLHQVKGEDGSLTFVAKSKELPGDAASVCLTYGLSKAKVIGFEPVTP